MGPKIRVRADQLAYEQGLCDSREKAKSLIMAARIAVRRENAPDEPVPKPGHLYDIQTPLVLLPGKEYVSRGAFKLLTILETLQIDVSGLVCLDAGASTGGFTDCLLQRGAARVYAVDVGKNQLHEKLRSDPAVISLEGVNLRYAAKDLIPEKIDFLTGDVSFISLTLVLPACLQWLKPGGKAALLIKPQFELSPAEVRKGVVRDENLRQKAISKVVDFCEQKADLRIVRTLPAQIRGPKGNQEYMALFEYHPHTV